MRTTLTIADALLDRVKDRASRTGATSGQVVEAALQHYLALPEPAPAAPLPVFTRGNGLRPGIDPTSNAALREPTGEPDLRASGLR